MRSASRRISKAEWFISEVGEEEDGAYRVLARWTEMRGCEERGVVKQDYTPGTSWVSLSLRTPILHFVGTSPLSSSAWSGCDSGVPALRPKSERHRERGGFSPSWESREDSMADKR